MSLGERTIKNAAYGFVSYIWPIAFSFFLTPFLIHRLGIEQYGVYVLMLTIIGFFSLLNFGFIYTFTKELAAADGAVAGQERLRKVFGMTLLLFIAVGVISLIVGLFFAYRGQELFNIQALSLAEIRAAFIWAGITGCINSISLVYSQIPFALQRQDIGTSVYLFNMTLFNLLIIAALFLQQGVATLLALQAITALITLFVLYRYSRRLAPWLTPLFSKDGALFKTMSISGSYVYLHSLSSTFLAQFDRLIISGMIGPGVLTYYAVPNSVTEKIQGTVISVSGILFPVTSQLLEQGNQERLQNVYRRAMSTVALLAAALSVAASTLGGTLLYYWVGEEVARIATPLLYWLVPTYFLLALYMPITNILSGIGRTRFLALCSLGMAVLNVGALIIFLPAFGITGAAIAYFAGLLPTIGIIYFIERRYFGLHNIGSYYGKLFMKLLITGVLLAAVVLLIKNFIFVNLVTVAIGGLATVVAYIGLYKLLGFFNEEDWRLVSAVGKSFARKLMILRA